MGADSNAPPLVPLQTPPAETARAPAELAAPNASRAPAAALAAPPTLAPPTAPTVVTTAPAVPSYAPPPAAARAAKEGRSAGAAASAPASAAVAQATPSQATPPAAAAAPARIPLLSELPATLRKQLPPLAVGGSVYSDDAAARFIMLNGDVVKEGGQPAPGLVVERIEARSAVLRFQGERFRLPY
jgi:general secretion pathway protein B